MVATKKPIRKPTKTVFFTLWPFTGKVFQAVIKKINLYTVFLGDLWCQMSQSLNPTLICWQLEWAVSVHVYSVPPPGLPAYLTKSIL